MPGQGRGEILARLRPTSFRSASTLRSVGLVSCSTIPLSAAESVMPGVDHDRQLAGDVDQVVFRDAGGEQRPRPSASSSLEHLEAVAAELLRGLVERGGLDAAADDAAEGVADAVLVGHDCTQRPVASDRANIFAELHHQVLIHSPASPTI